MADALAHRGPDGRASWGDAEAGIGLGHRRLAIVDLTPTGAQPMHSAGGRYVIAYNGEVYNFQELRAELAARGHRFRGTSDTEVMLAACVEWGPEQAVERFVGMFAFALFDRQTRTLRLVRDRLGVKPLYWAVFDGALLFGSELRALMAHPAFRKEVDREAIAAVLRYSYVPAPATVFRGVYKLPAGFDPDRAARAASRWSRPIGALPTWSHAAPSRAAPTEAVERLDALLRDAVRRRMIADVPLGAFLSGGTDSSTVVALMQAQSERPVRTLHHRLPRRGLRRVRPCARRWRAISGPTTPRSCSSRPPRSTSSRRCRTGSTSRSPIPRSCRPISSPARRDSTSPSRSRATAATSCSAAIRNTAGSTACGARRRPAAAAARRPRRPGGSHAGRPAPARRRRHRSGARRAGRREGAAARRGARRARPATRLRLRSPRSGSSDAGLVHGASGCSRPEPVGGLRQHLPDLVSRMQAHDMATYLPDDILTKVDRCSMAVALEAREPLLDHRLVEFVWSLPAAVRRGDGTPKALLRAVLARYLPPALIDRPKHGFSVPLADWLRGPLRDWGEDLLAPARLAADGLFDPTRTRAIWQRHLSGVEDNATGLWNVLMVQAWARRWT